MFNYRQLISCIAIVVLVSSCKTLRLLDSNKEFGSLMLDSAEAGRLYSSGELDSIAYQATMEKLRIDFAANGDRAVKAAEEADTDPSKASLLNVAVRSYLKTGGARDNDILTYATQGIDTCSRLSGLDNLPTTCGYFHIVIPQAVSNEWTRKLDEVQDRQDQLGTAGESPVEDGRTLIAAANGYMQQLVALEQARPKIDFKNAGESLETYFNRQQDIIFCQAQNALVMLRLVVATGEGWDRGAEETQARARLAQRKVPLEKRENGFPAMTCRDLRQEG